MPQFTKEIISYCDRNKYAIFTNVVTAAIFGSAVGSFFYKPEVVDFLVSKAMPFTQSLIMCNAFTVFSPIAAIAFNNIFRGKNVLGSLTAMAVLAFNISNLLSTAKTFTPAEKNDIEENWMYEKSDLTTENLLSRSMPWSLFLPTMAAAGAALFAYVALMPLDNFFKRTPAVGRLGGVPDSPGGVPGVPGGVPDGPGGLGGLGGLGGGAGSPRSADRPIGGGGGDGVASRTRSRLGNGRVVQGVDLSGNPVEMAVAGNGRYLLRGPRILLTVKKTANAAIAYGADVVGNLVSPQAATFVRALRFEIPEEGEDHKINNQLAGDVHASAAGGEGILPQQAAVVAGNNHVEALGRGARGRVSAAAAASGRPGAARRRPSPAAAQVARR